MTLPFRHPYQFSHFRALVGFSFFTTRIEGPSLFGVLPSPPVGFTFVRFYQLCRFAHLSVLHHAPFASIVGPSRFSIYHYVPLRDVPF